MSAAHLPLLITSAMDSLQCHVPAIEAGPDTGEKGSNLEGIPLVVQIESCVKKLMHQTLLAAFNAMREHAHYSLVKRIAVGTWRSKTLLEAFHLLRCKHMHSLLSFLKHQPCGMCDDLVIRLP